MTTIALIAQLIRDDTKVFRQGECPSAPSAVLTHLNVIATSILGSHREVIYRGDDDNYYKASVRAVIERLDDIELKNMHIVQCLNCGHAFTSDNQDPSRIGNLFNRVKPGDPMPACECPKCHGLCYPAVSAS